MKYSESELKNMYEQLILARIWSDKWERGAYNGQVVNSAHLPHGQEAVGIGVQNALREVDYLAPSHRFQPALLQRYDLQAFTSEVFNKVGGFRRGICFDFHISDIDNKTLFCEGTLGSAYPIHTGFAWSLKSQGKEGVVVTVQGDGAVAEGNVYEAWQFAALHKLPVLFIIENNDWGEGSRTHEMHAVTDLAPRVEPLGMWAEIVDGNDVMAVREAVEQGIARAAGFEPGVIEFKTLRWKGHFAGDFSDQLVDPEEQKKAMEHNDPVKRFEGLLKEQGVIDDVFVESCRNRIDGELEEIFRIASEDRFATKEEVVNYDWIYATPATGGEL